MFDDPPRLKRGALRPLNDRQWRADVSAVLDRFQRAFPEIEYDVAWNVRALNGVAWREPGQRHVRLYGGLVRHRLIGLEACALLLAHETGHHYGGPPRDSVYEWMSCECQADFWAARHGVRMAWGGNDAEARHQVTLGARQILAFERSMIDSGANWVRPNTGDADCLDHASPDDRYRIFTSGAGDGA
jgi:hypothetical protein